MNEAKKFNQEERNKEQDAGSVEIEEKNECKPDNILFSFHLPQTIYCCIFGYSVIHKSFEYSQQSQAKSWKLNKDE